MRRVAVIDYGMGNLRSVSKALETVGKRVDILVTSDQQEIQSASHIVFPGVGAMRDCMAELKRLRLDHIIKEVAKTKPFLGVCLGMQALLTESEENNGSQGLNIIAGSVKQFDLSLRHEQADSKVPHMGWNTVTQRTPHPLWQNIDSDSHFYFVHSYYVKPEDSDMTAATTHYQHDFTSALHNDNIFAVQFHPEKSQQAGLQLLENFLNWDGQS